MKGFEKTRQDIGIERIALPTASPEYNGEVERTNRILIEEFYENSQIIS